MRHYDHIAPIIHQYFKRKGMTVAIEPHGTRGPDLKGINGTIMVGEIKNQTELLRDLRSYWSSWNSNQSFGGKKKDFKLRSILPATVEALSSFTKGWIATIYGQLKYPTEKGNLTEGWLVYEGFSFENSLLEALNFLSQHNFTRNDKPEHLDNLGFVKILY